MRQNQLHQQKAIYESKVRSAAATKSSVAKCELDDGGFEPVPRGSFRPPWSESFSPSSPSRTAFPADGAEIQECAAMELRSRDESTPRSFAPRCRWSKICAAVRPAWPGLVHL